MRAELHEAQSENKSIQGGIYFILGSKYDPLNPKGSTQNEKNHPSVFEDIDISLLPETCEDVGQTHYFVAAGYIVPQEYTSVLFCCVCCTSTTEYIYVLHHDNTAYLNACMHPAVEAF